MLKVRTLYVDGFCNNDGTYKVNGINKMNDFFKKNKGTHILASFTTISGNDTEKLIAYYYAKFIPFIVDIHLYYGDLINKEQADYFLREFSTITNTREFINGSWIKVLKRLESLDYNDLLLFMEDIRIKVAENLEVNID